MTGFGEASTSVDEVHYSLELRSLNNRYFKCSMRLPDVVAGLEPELDALIRRKLARGSVTLTLRMYGTGVGSAKAINQAVIRNYLDQLRQAVGDDAGLKMTIDPANLLALPGVVEEPDEESILHNARPVALELAEKAADSLIRMRNTEGRGIRQDLERYRDDIRRQLDQVAQRAPTVIEEYHTRLRSRIDDLLARAQLQVDQVDLIREIGIFAERADINEELSRIRAHLDQFNQLIGDEDPRPVGRTLDFLTQELLREANTIGSKSGDASINRAIVEVKGAIDRIKEQVQNVE
ncbi:MAG: YicC family protein [Phycisphaeraceae bacterium]|nr:YicC family protein [Phycisphaeraceae bacterium]